MPRDKRLWMTFPIDFWQHPKVGPLPVDAKWAFVEMNGYSRMHDLDGNIPAVMAKHMWKKRSLDALVASHPDRPLVQLVDDVYVIRDYSEHQQTVAEREAAAENSRVNGAKGGRPRKNPGNPAGFTPGSVQVPNQNPARTQSKAESETESETDTYKTSQSGHLPKHTAIDSTDPDLIHVSRYGIDIPAVVAKVEAVYGQTPNARAIKQMADAVFGSAKNPKNPTAVLLTSVERDGKEWRAALAGEQVKR